MDDVSRDATGRAEPELPPDLVRELAAAFGRSVPVPEAVDRRILAAARRRLAGRTRRRALAWWAGAASAAAAILIACLLAGVFRSDPADLDRNGTVNILDAFLLARRIEGGNDRPAAWDIDGDGLIDRRDVDAIAQRAVSLGG